MRADARGLGLEMADPPYYKDLDMSLSARDGSYGEHAYFEDLDITRKRYVNGVQTDTFYGTVRKLVHYDLKEGTRSNPPRLLPNSNTMWRNPTGYTRGIMDAQYGRAKWSRTTGNIVDVWEQKCNYDDGDYQGRQVPYGAFYWNGPYAQWSGELESEAIAKAVQRIKDQRVGLGEDLATARQTLGMVAEEGRRLLLAARALKHGQIGLVGKILRNQRSAVKIAGSYYAQYQYGWAPLMSDIFAGCALAREQLKKPALIVSASAKSREESIRINSTPGQETFGKGKRSAYCKLYGRVNGRYSALADSLQVTNPISLAWELVPFSFMVDWFVPVGRTLDSFIAPAGLDFLGGFTTQRGELNYESTMRPNIAIGEEGPPIVNRIRGFSINRRTYGSWPRAGFYTVNPFESHAAWQHGANTFAILLANLFK